MGNVKLEELLLGYSYLDQLNQLNRLFSAALPVIEWFLRPNAIKLKQNRAKIEKYLCWSGFFSFNKIRLFN